jgi:hypothetical protein
MQTHYFPHDYHARHDAKLLALRRRHGLAGLGAFWCLVEYLYEQDGALPRAALADLAYDLRCDDVLLADVLESFGLFEYDAERQLITSAAVTARLQVRAEKREKAQKSASNRWQHATALRTHSERTATASQPASDRTAIKGKERKEKERKEKENTTLPLPLPDASASLVEEVRTEPPKVKPAAQPFLPTGLTKALLLREDVAPAWEAFLAQRTRLRAPNTGYALELVVKKLRELRGDDGAGWAELLNAAVERGWRSVFEIHKTTPTLTPPHHGKPTLSQRDDDAARHLLRG